jgi:hypothetical protein
MPSLEMTQIAWWDEVHMKQKLGFMNLARTSTSVRFYRNTDGTVANKAEDGHQQGGVLANETEVLHVKFPGEMRGSFGCALVEKVLLNGTKVEVPLRAEPFFYTEQVIITIKRYKKLISEELARIKGIKKTSGWVIDPRPSNATYQTDCVTILHLLGEATRKKLNVTLGIVNLGQLSNMTEDQMRIMSQLPGRAAIPYHQLETWRSQAIRAFPGSPPPIVADPHRIPLRYRPHHPYLQSIEGIVHKHNSSKRLVFLPRCPLPNDFRRNKEMDGRQRVSRTMDIADAQIE